MSVATSTPKLTMQSTVRLSSGHEMPILGLGVYENDECYPACIAALELGYRHIDSARFYMNEAAMGKAVRDSGVKREEVFVTSKIWYPDYGYESTLLCVDDSLEKIGLEYIDLYLIHSPETGKKSRLDTWRALIEQRNRGKLRTIGVSNFNVKHIEEIREAGLELPAVNQMEIHPYCQNRPIVEYCKKNGIVLQAYCPLIRGQFDNPLFVELADKYNKTIAQVLVRWSLQHGFSPLPKSSRAHRIKENADVHDFEISDEDIARLDALDKGDDGALEWNPIHVD